jgi:RNA polymerase sigma-70 factor (ECF subfamily)
MRRGVIAFHRVVRALAGRSGLAWGNDDFFGATDMIDRENRWAGWMRAAHAGDQTAYRRLLADLVEPLRLTARRGLQRAGRSVDDAEDIVQDTLLALHQKRHTWDASQPFGPWIRGIARHKLVDALRRRRAKEVPLDDLIDSFVAPDTGPDFAIRDVVRLADGLTGGQKAVVLAVAVDGCSGSEAAARLSMSEGAVRVALHRGVTRLAAMARTGDGRG